MIDRSRKSGVVRELDEELIGAAVYFRCQDETSIKDVSAFGPLPGTCSVLLGRSAEPEPRRVAATTLTDRIEQPHLNWQCSVRSAWRAKTQDPKALSYLAEFSHDLSLTRLYTQLFVNCVGLRIQ